MKPFLSASLLALSLSLAACATSDSSDTSDTAEADPRRGAEVDRICFTQSIDGFGETTRNTVVVREGVNQHYLVEVFRGCLDLDHAQSLAFDSFSGCLTRGDAILAFDSAFGPSPGDAKPLRCRIKTIYEWDPDAGKPDADSPEADGEVETPEG